MSLPDRYLTPTERNFVLAYFVLAGAGIGVIATLVVVAWLGACA